MPSASAKIGLLVVSCLPLVAALTACGTTQETSARLKVRADRILASREPVSVERANPDVRVVDAAILSGGKEGAVVVTLQNTGTRLLNDLPLTVAVKTASGNVVVNRGTSFRYFEAHSPALPPRGATTWVLTLPSKELPPGSPLIKVGFASQPLPTVAHSLPRVQVSGVAATTGGKEATKGKKTVKASISNEGGFPQYDLSVYAWAKRDGRFVAAAQKSIGDLGTDESAEVRLALVGDPGTAKVHVSAPPTIFE